MIEAAKVAKLIEECADTMIFDGCALGLIPAADVALVGHACLINKENPIQNVMAEFSLSLLFKLRRNFLLQRSSMMTTVKEEVSHFDRRIDHLHATAEMLRHIEEKKYIEEANRCNDSSELVSWFVNGLKDEQRLFVENLAPRTLHEAIKIAYLDHR
ncbi:hypothetical protein AKJ16_DCAP12163 [Drosera capensis]